MLSGDVDYGLAPFYVAQVSAISRVSRYRDFIVSF
ncbi:hypothetical protein M529_02695 [Sphingobium ummariense RL-3]|uniref:Uncharacterized protein n=1 Tax=Sphingobium ummariense RL-3 TaxID=1346791 RepID=T0KB67_9SPHN|nr:hypothetical protein M529_02695 [Sphingobium ummariense RL-3]